MPFWSPTKAAVLDEGNLDNAGIANQDAALRQAAGQAFYNTSRFTLRDLRNRAASQLNADFEAYLDGFSPNVQEISTTSSSAIRSPSCRRRRAWHADREVPRPDRSISAPSQCRTATAP